MNPSSAPIRWSFVVDRAAWGVVIITCALVSAGYVAILVAHPDSFGNDAIIYFRATGAWLAGADPWSAARDGTTFGGIPPTLLLSLPLQPFGEEAARWFWPLSGAVAMMAALRAWRLHPIWLLWPPFLEGTIRGGVDATLIGATLVGAGALAALTKPYAIPAMLWERRRTAVGSALVAGVVLLVALPWPYFVQRWPAIETVISAQSSNLSAWGDPLAMAAVGLAAVAIRRDILPLLTPGLWPHSQMHYALWSLRFAATNPILALGLALPFRGAPVVAIALYAVMRLTFLWLARGTAGRVATSSLDRSVRPSVGWPRTPTKP